MLATLVGLQGLKKKKTQSWVGREEGWSGSVREGGVNYSVQHSQRYSKIFLKEKKIIKHQLNTQFNFKQGKCHGIGNFSKSYTHGKCTVLVTSKIQIKTTQDFKFTRMARTPKWKPSEAKEATGNLKTRLVRLWEEWLPGTVHQLREGLTHSTASLFWYTSQRTGNTHSDKSVHKYSQQHYVGTKGINHPNSHKWLDG